MRFEFLSSGVVVFAAMVGVADAVKGNTETLLRREMPEPLSNEQHDREKIERQARWAEKLEHHKSTGAEVPSSAHEHAGDQAHAQDNMITYVDELQTSDDPASLEPRFNSTGKQFKCLVELMKDGGDFTKEKVCSNATTNDIKDDHGNFIRYTMREDKVAIKIWENVMTDCQNGQTYLRDIVEGFGTGVSCFGPLVGEKHEWPELAKTKCASGPGKECDEAIDDNKTLWYIRGKKIERKSGNKVELDASKAVKRICEGGEKQTPGTLDAYQKELKGLVQDYDVENAKSASEKDTVAMKAICKKMYMAHAADPYGVRNVLVYSRPYSCSNEGNKSDCEAMEKWYMEFMDRNMFAMGAIYKKAKKGRASENQTEGTGFAHHSATCTSMMLGGKPFFKAPHTTKHGITVDFNGCTVDPDKEIIDTAEQRKGGLFGSDRSDNLIGKHFEYCGTPFVAGVSGSLPQYLMFAMGSKKKTNEKKGWKEALDDKELLAMVGMLELAGFHSITELMFSVNFYGWQTRGKLLVTPPFDGGSFTDTSDLEIRCNDKVKSCCDKTKMMSNTHEFDTTAYEAMMTQFEAAVTSWAAVSFT